MATSAGRLVTSSAADRINLPILSERIARQPRTMPDSHSSVVRGIALATGLTAGTLDALAASTQFYLRTGNSPAGVWRYVASALLGPAARTGGAGTVLVGILMHYGIALGWTVVFFVAASRWPTLRANPWIVGPLYGVFVWAMMTRVLVPLTRIGPPGPFNLSQAATAAAIIVVCVGTPIAFGARRAFGAPPGAQ